MFGRLAVGNFPKVSYDINGHHYTKGYHLADGIYPQWATFVKTISNPQDEMRKRFAKEQESARKDVERAFGALQSRWAIVRHPARTWSPEIMWSVMTACVIMHNMIVEDERDDSVFDENWLFQGENVEPQQGVATFEEFIDFQYDLRDHDTHASLQDDLV